MQHPDWSQSAAIYQLNQRQLTPEGTFRAAEEHLPRIRDLGVEIIWLMPVHPIGEVNRKGRLGSPYAVRDYLAVNPEFGTIEDLRHFVATAHELGLKVILDWVANHTAWDNVLVEQHPEWYARDWKGDFRPTPWWDWDDIIDLDYDHPEHGGALREYMAQALEFWVRECDVDGYRCDVAGFVPLSFWEAARARLDAIKPVFMLAEWETRDLHNAAFDASYAWSWNESLHLIAAGQCPTIEPLRVFYAWNERSWSHDSMRMTFVSNHDHNHAEGTEYERFGDALPAVTVLSVIGSGIPLVYTGQELGNRRRLEFFDKDVVSGDNEQQAGLYRALFRLKKQLPALWNGGWGARMVRVVNDQEDHVLSFVRADDASRVLAVFNLSPERRSVTLGAGPHPGEWTDAFSQRAITFSQGSQIDLPAWGWRVFTG
ncbi:alpha-amylase family glycosyl hydrolase [Nocardioides sp.]|uniref:alpha-amylase family glycosyl hydrolase n=1 Tax=Nocardioides sp. TaxID=35761 RepID=UPI003D0DC5C3